jgi:N-acetylornithine carbamoyltransferase
VNHFVALAQLTRGEIAELLSLARRLESRPEPHALSGKILGLLFLNPSLRTLASFQAAMARLGGSSFVVTPGHGTWQFETRLGVAMNGSAAEHVREGIPVLASYCDALGIRAFADGRSLAADLADEQFRAMQALSDKPVINLESAINHPCQALADWKTLDDLRIPERCRSPFRPRSWTWRRGAATRSWCCARTATRCRTRSWTGRARWPLSPAAR